MPGVHTGVHLIELNMLLRGSMQTLSTFNDENDSKKPNGAK